MDELNIDGHGDKPEGDDGGTGQQNLAHNVNPTPNDQASTEPQTAIRKEENQSLWAEFLEAVRVRLHHYRDAPQGEVKWTDQATVALTLLIAIAAFWSACIFQRQLKEARKANTDTETQWTAQQRPWVGLSGNVEFPKQPVFEVLTSNAPQYTGIDLATVLKVKNYGVSPAFGTVSKVAVLLTGNTATLPQDQMVETCSLADQPIESEGDVIFPGGDITASFDTTINQPIELANIRRVWITGCIAYRDDASGVIHHTKFWIMSFMVPENSTPSIVERNARGTKFTLAVNGWEMVKTEAD